MTNNELRSRYIVLVVFIFLMHKFKCYNIHDINASVVSAEKVNNLN